MRPGGITDEERPVTADEEALFAPLQPEIEAEVGKSMDGPIQSLVPQTYKSQVVAGVNYFVKYRVNESGVYYHARIYRDLEKQVHLVRISGPKTDADPIEYF